MIVGAILIAAGVVMTPRYADSVVVGLLGIATLVIGVITVAANI